MVILHVYKDLILNSAYCNLAQLDHILKSTCRVYFWFKMRHCFILVESRVKCMYECVGVCV